ncbi:MAG TPA: MATE family efflux transporter [Flavisolibacter sp.]|nr:MATE family efflux transporter [Flavisolibacter sp.]
MPKTQTAYRLRSIFSLFIKALQGEQQDYTTGSMRRAVIMLAIPMILEMGMESVFAIVDLFFVGKLGKHAISTVGLTESVLTIIYSIAIGMSMAATATVARRVGEKDEAGAATAAMQSILLSIIVILVFSLTGIFFARNILQLMGAEPGTLAIGINYTRLMMGSSMIIMLLFLINGIFRGAGNAAIAMKSLWVANISNIILCPVLIQGFGPIPALGVTGAALATTVGRSIGVCYQLYHLFNGKSIVKLTKTAVKVQWKIMKSLIDIAWPATMQFVIGSCSWIFMAKLVAQTGHSAASAGYQTALRIVTFFILPAWGVSNAAATLVGQNLGAGSPERAEDAVMKTAKYNAIFMASVSLLFFFVSDGLVSVFVQQNDVRSIAVMALRIISAGYIFYGIGMVMVSAFNGAGDTRTPTIINIFCFWLFQVPLAFILAKTLGMGPKGVFYAIPIAETAITITAYVVFKKGRWKTVKV